MEFMTAILSNKARQILLDRVRSVLLQRLPDVQAIYVYGSFARGENRTDSDVDVAVLLPRGKQIADLLGVIGELSEALNCNADLVDVRRAGNILRKEILSDGITVYAREPEAVLGWEAEAMSEYAEHRERIREILAQFRETGIGYAR
jgi:uncharacterized protein